MPQNDFPGDEKRHVKGIYMQGREEFNMKGILAVCLMALLLMSQEAAALGIGPARTELDFEPGLSEELFVVVFNEDDFEQEIDLYVKGDLEDYVELSTSKATIPANSNAKITFTLALPQAPPGEGKLDTRIGAVQTVPQGVGNAVAKVAVESQLWIYAPYQGKKLEASLEATDVKPGEDVELILGISNVGTEDVDTSPSIIVSKEEEEIGTIDFGSVHVPSMEEKTLKESYPTESLDEGTYNAVALVPYNGETAKAVDNFSIGGFIVKITDIFYKGIVKGEIARFDVEVDNLWSKPVEGIYIEASAYGEEKTSSFKSETTSIAGGETKKISLFWDTTEIETGEYLIRFVLYYGEKTDSKDIDVSVSEGFGAPHLINIVLAIVLAMLLLLYYKRRKKKT